MHATIPHVIHQIWLGGEPPEQIREWMAGWRATQHDWEYRLWTDRDAEQMPSRAQFLAADSYAAKADIFRVDILSEHGGVYVDADYEPHRPIDSLVWNRSAVLLSEGPYLTNSFMAFAAGHPILRSYQAMIAAVEAVRLSAAGDDVLTTTGPLALTRAVSEHTELLEDPGTVILAPDYFLVPKTRNAEILELAAGRRLATHHAAASWRTGSSLSGLIRSTRLRTRVRRFLDLSAS